MNTGGRTTYIWLSRGDEDKRLYKEIDRVRKEFFKRPREFYKEFPLLTALHSGLRDEIDAQEEEP